MELAELVTELDKLIGDDKAKAKEARDALRNSSGGSRLLAQSLIDVGQGGKASELQGKLTTLTQERDTAIQERDEAKAALETERGKQPNAAEIEKQQREKWEPKVKAAEKRAEKSEARSKELQRQVARDLVHAALIAPAQDGTYVEPEYADLVLGRYVDRFVDKEDGSLGVLQLGESTEYDGADVKAKATALAMDIRKAVQPRYMITSADSGAGVRSGSGGGSRYDAVKIGTEMGQREKAQAADNKLAFK